MFFDNKGILLSHPLPEHTTMTGSYFANLVTMLREEIKHKRRGMLFRGVIMHCDNAAPHRSSTAQEALQNNGMTVMGHILYSPDLAPADFVLFSTMKDFIRGRRIDSRSALGSALYQWSQQQPEEWFAQVFQKWVKRWDSCIAFHGDYVEKQ
jgi:histone-lysine N-methyltransferase SETMAR